MHPIDDHHRIVHERERLGDRRVIRPRRVIAIPAAEFVEETPVIVARRFERVRQFHRRSHGAETGDGERDRDARRPRNRIQHRLGCQPMRDVSREVGRPRFIPRSGRVCSGKLIAAGHRHRLQDRAKIVVIGDEFIRQVGQQSGVHRLRIEFVEIEVVDRLHEREAEHFLPEIVDRRPRELRMRRQRAA